MFTDRVMTTEFRNHCQSVAQSNGVVQSCVPWADNDGPSQVLVRPEGTVNEARRDVVGWVWLWIMSTRQGAEVKLFPTTGAGKQTRAIEFG